MFSADRGQLTEIEAFYAVTFLTLQDDSLPRPREEPGNVWYRVTKQHPVIPLHISFLCHYQILESICEW